MVRQERAERGPGQGSSAPRPVMFTAGIFDILEHGRGGRWSDGMFLGRAVRPPTPGAVAPTSAVDETEVVPRPVLWSSVPFPVVVGPWRRRPSMFGHITLLVGLPAPSGPTPPPLVRWLMSLQECDSNPEITENHELKEAGGSCGLRREGRGADHGPSCPCGGPAAQPPPIGHLPKSRVWFWGNFLRGLWCLF